MRTLELIPYQKAKKSESLAIDSLLKQFFSLFWHDKEDVITSAALCNVSSAEWVESSGTDRLEFAQMPTASDEVEAGLRWEASAGTARAAIRTVLLYDIVK
jgi:hypothetical protein